MTSFVRLARDLATVRNVVLPTVTHSRYVANTQGTTPLTVTSPADNTSVTSSPVTVTGTTAPGSTVYVSSTNTDTNAATTVVSTTAGGDGSIPSVDVAITGGTNVLNVVAVSPSGEDATLAGPMSLDVYPEPVLDVADPDGDDASGNYAYPTFAGFRPGAFDIQRFQVFDSGDTVTFRLRTRDLSETFGSPLGAQLVDVYSTRPGRGGDVHGGGAFVALRDCTGVRVEPADPGAGLRPALRGRGRHCTRDGDDLGEPDLTLHHLQRPEGDPRDARPRMGVRRRPHRPGRLQPRPGPQLRADAAGLPVRRLRDRELRSPLHVRPRPRSRQST